MRGARVLVAPGEGDTILSGGGMGVVLKLSGTDTGDSFSVVEHPLGPRTLAAPPHTHANEDEVSFVIEGEIGAQVGGEVVRAPAGAYVVKPRGIPHTFWNPGARPARVLEIISPAGFERYFGELARVLSAAPPGGPPDLAKISEVAGRYGLTFEWERLPGLLEEHGLTL